MRKGLLLAVLPLVVAASLPVPGAAAQAPTQDSVTGSLTPFFVSGRDARIWAINASSGPFGESPTGNIQRRDPFFTVNWPVTCLQVTANRAVIGGRLTSGTTVAQAYLIVVDEPDGIQDRILDRVFVNDPTVPATCAEFEAQTAGTTPPPAQSGSVVVIDSQPLPTSKDQCKNNGWKTFGVFKNQGDCVSFVATGGQNPPANSP